MAKDIERDVWELVWLRSMLASGRARALVKTAGLSTATVGQIIGCAQPNAWKALAGKQFPRRGSALKLAHLLQKLEVLDRAAEDSERVLRP